MILGVGVDIIEPERIERAMDNARFMERVYTESERERIAQAGRSGAQRAAGIFAGKEAAVKALGCGFNGVGMRDVEILSDEAGRPHIAMHDGAERMMRALGASHVHIAISHIERAAVAFVVLEGDADAHSDA